MAGIFVNRLGAKTQGTRPVLPVDCGRLRTVIHHIEVIRKESVCERVEPSEVRCVFSVFSGSFIRSRVCVNVEDLSVWSTVVSDHPSTLVVCFLSRQVTGSGTDSADPPRQPVKSNGGDVSDRWWWHKSEHDSVL